MPRKKKTETEEGASAVNPAPTLPAAPTEKDSRAAFYALDFNGLDRNLPPEVQQEWMAIYASFRSRSALSGAVVGVDRLKPQNGQIAAETPAEGVLCLVIINHRVKVLIPQTEIWHDSTEEPPDFVINGMVGANAEYVITHVDKEGDFALGSRKMALGFKRNRFMNNRNGHRAGEIVDCNILSVGPVLLRAECGGFDFQLRPRDVSYTAMRICGTNISRGSYAKRK